MSRLLFFQASASHSSREKSVYILSFENMVWARCMDRKGAFQNFSVWHNNDCHKMECINAVINKKANSIKSLKHPMLNTA